MKYKSLLTLVFLLIGTSLFSQNNRDQNWIEDINYTVNRIEIMHPKMYANISEVEFKENTKALIERVPSLSDVEVVLGISELLAGIRDGHTGFSFFNSDPEVINKTFHSIPLSIYPFPDGIYIISAAKKYEESVGKKVLKINNIHIDEVVKRVSKVTGEDNQYGKLKALPFIINVAEVLKYYGIGNSITQVTLELENELGKSESVSFETQPYFDNLMKLFRGYIPAVSDEQLTSMNVNSSNPLPLWLTHTLWFSDEDQNYWFKYLEDKNTYYLQINSLNHKSSEDFTAFINRMFKELDGNKAQKLIVDLRLNDGGNHIEMPLIKGILARPELDKPENLFVLISRVTFSGAQHVTSILSRYTKATLMGQPTSGRRNHYGAVRPFSTPNNKGFTFRSSVDFYQDGQPFDFTRTTEPDFIIPLTSVDFKQNIDRVIELVFKFDLVNRLRTEFPKKMADAYIKGGLDGSKSLYFNIKEDYTQYGFNMENLLFKDFDTWIFNNEDDKLKYIEYLEFVYDELPNSITVCYDLAHSTERHKSKEEARALYNRCLELNPEHHYAKMRLRLLSLEESVK
jgi:hypothetical protein